MGLPANPSVAIAIVGFRNAGDIATCLAALETSTHANFAVYVCENGGEAAYEALLKATPERLAGGQAVVRINAGENLGYAGGVNRCIAAAGEAHDAVWVLNPDTAPEPGALAALLERLGRGDVDAVGGVTFWSNGLIQAYGGVWRPWSGSSESIGMFSDPEVVRYEPGDIERRQNYLCGASMLVSRAFIERTGPMQEDFFLYAEEVEWCLRAQRLGLKLGFAPQARVRHFHGTTTGWGGVLKDVPRLSIYLDARNRVRLAAQTSLWRLFTAVPFILAQSVWRYGRRGAWRQVCYVFEGVAAALRGERGRPAWVR